MEKLFLLSMMMMGAFSSARAENEIFNHYPATKVTPTCKDLDFGSYYRAQDAKKHLVLDNPDRSKPNFGGKYILLKNEMLMETAWLIADCETGKFIRESIKGKIEFTPKSLLVLVATNKTDEPYQYQLWTGEEWTRVDEAPKAVVAAATPSTSVTPANNMNYGPYFAKYPATIEKECKKIDFNSYFRAQGAQGNIASLNPDMGHPNFAGKYLLLKNDVIFERVWLIADCTTGKFLNQTLKGNLEFRVDSALVLARFSNEFPRLMVWREERFVEILNPVRSGKQIVENTVYDDEAKDLLKAIGASTKESKVTFESLKCAADTCTVKRSFNPEPKVLTPEQAKIATALLQRWGGEIQDGAAVAYSIDEGKCTHHHRNPVCEIRLSR